MKHRIEGIIGLDVTVDDLENVLQNANGEELELVISSPGGSIPSGFAMVNLIKEYSGKTSSTIDFSFSMATIVALACDEVKMQKNGLFMIHRPKIGAITGAEADDLRNTASTLDKYESMIIDVYSEKTGMNREELSAMLENETYMTAEEALSHGFIDAKVEENTTLSALKNHASEYAAKIECDLVAMQSAILKVESENAPNSLSDFEKLLRNEHGLSRKEATNIVSGIKNVAMSTVPQPSTENSDELAKELLALLNVFDK